MIVFFAANKGYMDDLEITMDEVDKYEFSLLNWIHKNHSGILSDIAREKVLTKEIEAHLNSLLNEFSNEMKTGATENG